jgi:hypothetical protein
VTGHLQYPTPPAGADHLYVVARFDGLDESGDPVESFSLTRGYWAESDAVEQADRLNRAAPEGSRYFVLVARVADPPRFAAPSA